MSFKPEDISFVDIFPPVNIARVGDSDEFFLGSEIPGVEPTPGGGFKDAQHKIKKQAARFRVYAYDKSSKVLGEVNNDEYTLKWTVHVANKKSAWVIFRGQYRKETWQLRNKTVQGWPNGTPAGYDYTDTRTKLIIDSGETAVEGVSAEPVPLAGEFWGSQPKATPVKLGEIRTDEHGRLLVLASDGHSYSAKDHSDQNLHSPFDNDDFVDSMCDGTVRVAVKSKSSPNLEIKVQNHATIITAPPRFASGTHCQTSLLELIEDVYEGQRRGPGYNVGEVDFYRHIYPLFQRMYLMSWTNSTAQDGHGAAKADRLLNNPLLSNPDAGSEGKAARERAFKRIRVPVKKGDEANLKIRKSQANGKFMPDISGDDGDATNGLPDRWASLTQLQYDRLQKWSQGDFKTGEPVVPYESFDKIPLDKQPEALTQSALEWSIGAPLYPGIETYWITQFEKMYKLDAKSYRFADSVKPGDLGRGLSLPWQSDFNMCNTHWWPSVRPDDVVTEEYFERIKNANLNQLDQMAAKLTDRAGWSDGIDSNSDMVQKWNKLGFVAREKYETKPDMLPIFIERQRDASMPHSS